MIKIVESTIDEIINICQEHVVKGIIKITPKEVIEELDKYKELKKWRLEISETRRAMNELIIKHEQEIILLWNEFKTKKDDLWNKHMEVLTKIKAVEKSMSD